MCSILEYVIVKFSLQTDSLSISPFSTPLSVTLSSCNISITGVFVVLVDLMFKDSVTASATLILLALVLYVSCYCVIVLFLVTGIVFPETCVFVSGSVVCMNQLERKN